MDPTILAYIAGFLDGDGSVFIQLIRKKDYCLGFQVRTSIAFYQDAKNEHVLHWLKEQLVAGYIRRRKTGICDYTIVEVAEVQRILQLIRPYVRLKAMHVELGLEILQELPVGRDASRLLALACRVDRFQTLNYSKKRTITSSAVREFLQSHGYLAPVETDPLRRESPALVDPVVAAKTPVASIAS